MGPACPEGERRPTGIPGFGALARPSYILIMVKWQITSIPGDSGSLSVKGA